MKLATALLIFSATGHASAGGPVADPVPAAPAAAAAAPDATEERPCDPGSNLRGLANGASTGVDVAAAPPDHQRRLQAVSRECIASHNSGILALQQASNVQHQQASNELQAAVLGLEFKTDNGHLMYPYAANLDPTGTSGQTAFDFVGNTNDWPADANGSRFYSFRLQNISTFRACGERCLARSAEVFGLVGYAYDGRQQRGTCLCQYDTAVAYPDSTVFHHTSTFDMAHLGTGRLRRGAQGDSWEFYERVYVL